MTGQVEHITAFTEQLHAEVIELSDRLELPYLNAQRKADISRKMGHIFFEIDCRDGKYDIA